MIVQYREPVLWWLAVILVFAPVLSGIAGDSKELTVDARLIWGTNDKFSPNTNHTAVSPEFAACLKNCLKWENYFLVTNEHATVAMGSIKSIRMSDRCVLEIKNLGNGRPAEVRVVGDRGQWGNTNLWVDKQDLVICGPAENKTAWIIFLRSGNKEGQSSKPLKKPAAEGKTEPVKTKDKPKTP